MRVVQVKKCFGGKVYIMNKKKLNFYHYTIFQHFISIIETRVIKKATAFCLPSIKTADEEAMMTDLITAGIYIKSNFEINEQVKEQ